MHTDHLSMVVLSSSCFKVKQPLRPQEPTSAAVIMYEAFEWHKNILLDSLCLGRPHVILSILKGFLCVKEHEILNLLTITTGFLKKHSYM